VWRERLETEVVGISGLTTADQYGTAEPGRHHNRQDFQADSINAIVVRTSQGKDYGPGSKTVLLTHASVAQPPQPFDDYDDRSLIENCWTQGSPVLKIWQNWGSESGFFAAPGQQRRESRCPCQNPCLTRAWSRLPTASAALPLLAAAHAWRSSLYTSLIRRDELIRSA
jgi:hypothetical protein